MYVAALAFVTTITMGKEAFSTTATARCTSRRTVTRSLSTGMFSMTKAIDKCGLQMCSHSVVFKEQDNTQWLAVTENPWFALLGEVTRSAHNTDNLSSRTVRRTRLDARTDQHR